MVLDEQTTQLLKELAKTSHGHALQRFLEQSKKELNDVSTIESYEECLGRKYALELIKDLFSFMEERKVENKIKNQYI